MPLTNLPASSLPTIKQLVSGKAKVETIFVSYCFSSTYRGESGLRVALRHLLVSSSALAITRTATIHHILWNSIQDNVACRVCFMKGKSISQHVGILLLQIENKVLIFSHSGSICRLTMRKFRRERRNRERSRVSPNL